MPEIIIVAGPNGAGKTTFANDFLPLERERFIYLNADEIARELAGQDLTPTQRDIRAAREMLQHLDASIAAQLDIMFETTLASKTYALKVPAWQRNGYQVKLFYLKLPNIEQSLARVARRVALGGNNIPAATIRQRFGRSQFNLENYYKPVVDEWYVWESLEGSFELRESWQD